MKQSDIFAAYVEQTKFLQTMLERVTSTLDRIVGAQYDRPIERHAAPPADPMPQMMLFDQGDVRPDDEIERGLNALGLQSDEEFLKAVN